MLLEVKNATKTYRQSEQAAVKGVSLSVQQDDFINIVGRSGSGKSTLLRMISGLLTPDSGSIVMNGQELTGLADTELSVFRNSHMGYIPQNASVLSTLTVFDNVRLPYYLAKRDFDACGRAFYLLEQVGLAHLANRMPHQLSGGELRRVLIARALMNSPRLLLADEPTGDLDIQTTGEIMELFSRIHTQGTAVLIVTHELDTLKFGKRVMTMVSGSLTEGLHLLTESPKNPTP